INRGQAICMMYCVEYNEENEKKFCEAVNDLKDVDICYEMGPLAPVLMPVVKINSNPFLYRRYPIEVPIDSPEDEITNDDILTSTTQIVHFLNETFAPCEPVNSALYEKSLVANKDILSILWNYTKLFDEKSALSFSKWCFSKKVAFTSVEYERKVQKGKLDRIRRRELWVLKKKIYG
ncbi:hypothetical protein DM01DRAFT_247021, partial [Hesseltinella vesiculosa]